MRASEGGSRVTQRLSCLRFGAHGRYVNELEHHGYWPFIRPWCCGGGASLGLAAIRRVTGSSARQLPDIGASVKVEKFLESHVCPLLQRGIRCIGTQFSHHHPIAWSPKYPRPPTAPHFLLFLPFSAFPPVPSIITRTRSPDPETINQVFLSLSNQLQAGFLAMCPPVNVRHGAKGMSCLYAAWLYQLVHGDQMKICFACFKAAFLVVKNMLEMGDWEEEEWGAEPMELSEAGSEPEEWLGLSWGEGQGHLSHGNSVSTGPSILTSGSVGTEVLGLGPQPVPTELGPQEAVPLDLGPEDAEWTQSLPWRFDGLSPCSHWLIPPLSWWDVFNVSPSPGQPVLLELSPIWPMDPLEAEAWLVDLKFVFLLGGFDAICYLLSMTPCWAVRTRVQRWQVLLDPGEVRVAQLQNAPEQQDLHRWRLSILESSELGVELVPADCSLRKGGFKVHSYLPWHSDTPEDWGSEPGERLLVIEVVSLRELPSFRSPSPDSQN